MNSPQQLHHRESRHTGAGSYTNSGMQARHRVRRPMIPTAKVPNYLRRFQNDKGDERPPLLPTPNMPPLSPNSAAWGGYGPTSYSGSYFDEYGVYASSYAGSLSPSGSAVTSNHDNYWSPSGMESDLTSTILGDSGAQTPSLGHPNNICSVEQKSIEPEVFSTILHLMRENENAINFTATNESCSGDITSLIDSIAGLFTPESDQQ